MSILDYDTKQSDGEVPVMQELWGMRSNLLLLSLPGQLWPRVVVPNKILSMGQIELNWMLMLNWIAWNRSVWHLNCVLMLNWIDENRSHLIFKLYTYAKLNCLQ